MRRKFGIRGIQVKISDCTILRFDHMGLFLNFYFILDARFLLHHISTVVL